MDKLPEISSILLSVMEHFAPMARSIHPDVEKGFILGKATELTNNWLEIEIRKAQEIFYEKRGVSLS